MSAAWQPGDSSRCLPSPHEDTPHPSLTPRKSFGVLSCWRCFLGAQASRQCSVGVDEARQDRLAPAVDDLQVAMVAGEIGARADRGDAAVPDGDGTIFKSAEGVVQVGDVGAGDENVGRVVGGRFDGSVSGGGQARGFACLVAGRAAPASSSTAWTGRRFWSRSTSSWSFGTEPRRPVATGRCRRGRPAGHS